MALPWVKCSAVQAEIKRCELLTRTLDVWFENGTLNFENVEEAVNETCSRQDWGNVNARIWEARAMDWSARAQL